jgi:hypothetical protein
MHSLADISDVCEDGFFVAFAVDTWRRDGVAFRTGGGEEGGVREV